VIVLLALLLQADAATLMKAAGARLGARCEGSCDAPPPDAAFRVEREADGGPRLKQRAVTETGTRCDTGARVCTRPPRTLLSAPLGR
jgi:hypothetical protein